MKNRERLCNCRLLANFPAWDQRYNQRLSWRSVFHLRFHLQFHLRFHFWRYDWLFRLRCAGLPSPRRQKKGAVECVFDKMPNFSFPQIENCAVSAIVAPLKKVEIRSSDRIVTNEVYTAYWYRYVRPKTVRSVSLVVAVCRLRWELLHDKLQLPSRPSWHSPPELKLLFNKLNIFMPSYNDVQ